MNDVITFGCRLNAYESEVIKNNLNGLKDVAVFNTCAVTKEAERQARQAIRKYNRRYPERKIIVTGCGAQLNPETYADLAGVTKVLGNEEKLDVKNYLSDEKILVNDIMSVTETAPQFVGGFEGKTRAFMQIQNGCDHRCTFCIIPFARGNNRSVPIGEIVKQAKILVNNGYKEIVLTGVDITGYGADLPASPTLGQMIRRMLNLVPELQRIRLSSVDVAEIDDDILDMIKNEPRFMPHLHLSLQAGDNMILKRMKRRHTREQVIEFCDKVKKIRPDITFGGDIIAGFPTETEEMFQNTLNIINEAGLTHLHVFPYSEREGTPAASIPPDRQVPVPVRKERAEKLRAAGKEQLKKFLKSRIGLKEKVLVEKKNFGRTENFLGVTLKKEYAEGMIKSVIIGNVVDDLCIEK